MPSAGFSLAAGASRGWIRTTVWFHEIVLPEASQRPPRNDSFPFLNQSFARSDGAPSVSPSRLGVSRRPKGVRGANPEHPRGSTCCWPVEIKFAGEGSVDYIRSNRKGQRLSYVGAQRAAPNVRPGCKLAARFKGHRTLRPIWKEGQCVAVLGAARCAPTAATVLARAVVNLARPATCCAQRHAFSFHGLR